MFTKIGINKNVFIMTMFWFSIGLFIIGITGILRGTLPTKEV